MTSISSAPALACALRLDAVTKTYGTGESAVTALRAVSVGLARGTFTAVMGPSGSGKSTFLHCAAGLDQPTSGTVQLGDITLSGLKEKELTAVRRERVGFVFQAYNLMAALTVEQNVALVPRLSGRAADPAWLRELLHRVGMGDRLDRRPSQLSGGQQQRVALARALAPRPGVVLMDEPFSSLDAGLRDELRADVRAALRAFGATALLVTHDQQEALGIADLVAVLRDGVVAQLGPPHEVYTRPADLGVALFVGEAVTFAGAVRDGTVDTPLGRLPASGTGSGTVLVRPEQLHLNSNGGVPATVADVLFHGHDATVLLRLADGTSVRSRVPGPVAVRPGEDVAVRVLGPALFFAGRSS